MDFIFFDAGGGHRNAAVALQTVIQAQGRPWRVNLVNLQEILDSLDIFRKITGLRLQDLYNLMLKKGWTLGSAQLLRPMQTIIRLYHRKQITLIEAYLQRTQPDLLVSFVPHFNRALYESLKNVLPDSKLITIPTDLADYPPHFWIEKQEQFLICGSEKLVEQAQTMGYPQQNIFRTSGMILHPRFYEPILVDRHSERAQLGLDPALPTGLVMFGGQGSESMLRITQRLQSSRLNVQLILICGRNNNLASKLRARRWRFPVFVEGFTQKVPYYMFLSDFFIGKPGPGSISEALAMKLPVIVERNAWTLPQERYNADWILQRRLGLVVKSFRHIHEAVAELLSPGALERCRSNAAALNNRAVFEIPEILTSILDRLGKRGC